MSVMVYRSLSALHLYFQTPLLRTSITHGMIGGFEFSNLQIDLNRLKYDHLHLFFLIYQDNQQVLLRLTLCY